MLTGKSIVIAAYKIANLASMLVKLNADVHVIMTQNATHFITPMTFETLTNNKCIVDTFDRNFNFDVKHVSLAKKGDLFLVAPCTANVIGKVASGICDDMLTTTIMATKAPVLFAPAMNTGMWENPSSGVWPVAIRAAVRCRQKRRCWSISSCIWRRRKISKARSC